MSTFPTTTIRSGATKPLGTNDPELRRGWFYRTVAPDPKARVLAVGAPFAQRWFPNVVEGTLAATPKVQLPESFGLVIVHATLGGCASLDAALAAASALLVPGGVVALAGYNRMRPARADRETDGRPCATPWGYRRAARRAGFREIDVFAARPALDNCNFALSTAGPSSRAFYRFDLAAQQASGTVRWPRARKFIASVGLATWLESAYVVVARKC